MILWLNFCVSFAVQLEWWCYTVVSYFNYIVYIKQSSERNFCLCRGISCNIMQVGFPVTEGQNTRHAKSVFTAHAQGITIVLWHKGCVPCESTRNLQSYPSKPKRRSVMWHGEPLYSPCTDSFSVDDKLFSLAVSSCFHESVKICVLPSVATLMCKVWLICKFSYCCII